MSKLFSRLKGFLSTKTLAGVDKAGNRYFTRKEEVDGIMKEKRWVIFKGEDDPTSIPVEWICWLNGQRKKAPTPQEMIQMEAMRERVKQNVLLLKKEEEERKASGANLRQSKNIGKDGSPDLKSFIQQFPGASFDHSKGEEESTAKDAAILTIGLRSQPELVNHSNQGHGSHQHEVKQPFCNTSLSRLICGHQPFENSPFACSPSEADPVTSSSTSTFCSLLKGSSGSTERFTIRIQERTIDSFFPYEWTPLTRWFVHWLSLNNIQKHSFVDIS